VTHIAITLFFSLIFIGAGIAAQMMVKEYWEEIVAALRGQPPVRKTAPAPRFKVKLRPGPQFAPALRRRAAF
jgi:hypothetical protein